MHPHHHCSLRVPRPPRLILRGVAVPPAGALPLAVAVFWLHGQYVVLVLSTRTGFHCTPSVALGCASDVVVERRGRKIALDVALGLAFLHGHEIVHLDIKSGNVLLARNLTAKISDVGLARFLHTQSPSSITGVGTFQYAAPEVLIGGMKV
jgi:serine/threonine protein kinase